MLSTIFQKKNGIIKNGREFSEILYQFLQKLLICELVLDISIMVSLPVICIQVVSDDFLQSSWRINSFLKVPVIFKKIDLVYPMK